MDCKVRQETAGVVFVRGWWKSANHYACAGESVGVGCLAGIVAGSTVYFTGAAGAVLCKACALAQGVAPPEEDVHESGRRWLDDTAEPFWKPFKLSPLPTADEAIAIQAEHIARADFESDPAVVSFVASAIDNRPPADPVGKAQYEKAMEIAWERDERGWRTACQERAKRIVSRMYGKAAVE